MASTAASPSTRFVMRLIGAVSVDPLTYEEVEADRTATGQALLVVILSSLGAGIGARGFGSGSLEVMAFISGVATIAWAAWALVTYQIGAKLMPEPQTRADVGELLRTIGFSSAPGMLRVFGIVPGAATAAFVITAIWMLIAMVVAVRQALDYTSTARAIVVCLLGWTLAIGIAVTLGLVFGPTVS
ncbi:MAG TPA: YIP1 family protein [Vicinamibacterales bacterium]|nr:YIP1 family protein [Vicinamibacterales bacterium]